LEAITSPAFRAIILATLTSAVLALGDACGTSASQTTATTSASVSAPKPDDLHTLAQALNDLADQTPGSLVDVDQLASSLTTPADAFEFVRDRLALEPYAGIEKGALGTLLTRGGNDVDRALLLSALLKAQGLEVTLAHGTLSLAQAQQLLDQIVAAPDAVHQHARAFETIDMPDATVPAPASPAPPLQRAVAARGEQLGKTIEDQYGWLATQLKAAAFSGVSDTKWILSALQDHYWVQATIDGKVTALDPSLASAQVDRPLTRASSTLDPDDLPATLFSTVTLRLVAEHLDRGKIVSTDRLSVSAHAADLIGKDLRFSIGPAAGGLKKANAFIPHLLIGDEETVGDPVRLLKTADEKSDSSSSAGGLGGFGFGGGSSAATKSEPAPDPNAPRLARVSLVMRWHSPGREDQTYRRIVLDRLSANTTTPQLMPAFADDAKVRPLLLQVWDGAASLGPLPLPFLLRQRSAELAAAADGAATLESAAAGQSKADPASMPGREVPVTLLRLMQSSDYERSSLARKLAVRCKPFYTGARLTFLRYGFEPTDLSGASSALAYREGIDIVNTPFAFACAAGADATPLAVKSGVADTALELLSRPRVATLDTIPIMAKAEAAHLSPFQATALTKVPPQIATTPVLSRVLGDTFSRGNLIVGPSGLIGSGGSRDFAWWEVSPNGCALGRANFGGGQGMTENLLTEEQQEQITEIVTKMMGEFLQCAWQGATKATIQWAQEPDVEKANEKIPEHADEEVRDCMVEAVCGALADLAFDGLADGMFGEILLDERTRTEKILNFLLKEDGLAQKAGSKGCASAITGG